MSSFASSSAHFNPGTPNPRFAQLFDDPSYMAIQAPRSILLDSRDRDFTKFPTPSDYVIKLPKTYNNITSARLVSAEIPRSYYVFTAAAGNTTMKFTMSGSIVPGPTSITIPDGNYGLATIVVAIKTALDLAFVADAKTFTVAIDASNSKTTITCSDASKTLTITTTTTRDLSYYLGFSVNSTAAGVASVTSPNVASLNPESYILISIDPLDRVDEAIVDGYGGGDRVFAKVPIAGHSDTTSCGVCCYDKQLTCNAILPPIAKLDQVRVRMRFHGSSSLIDFNGADHSLTIELQCSQTR